METHVYPSASMTVEEYLRFEEVSSERHEYVSGQIYAMSGVTIRHNLICNNLLLALHARMIDRCVVVTIDVKLRAAHDKIYYPDLMVVCGTFAPQTLVVTDPCLVIEVTSPSTRRIDRSEKLSAYRAIESLRTYLIVEQGAQFVEHHWRDADGTWQYTALFDRDAEVALPCPPTTVTLDTIYRRIEFDPPGRPRRVREAEPADVDES